MHCQLSHSLTHLAPHPLISPPVSVSQAAHPPPAFPGAPGCRHSPAPTPPHCQAGGVSSHGRRARLSWRLPATMHTSRRAVTRIRVSTRDSDRSESAGGGETMVETRAAVPSRGSESRPATRIETPRLDPSHDHGRDGAAAHASRRCPSPRDHPRPSARFRPRRRSEARRPSTEPRQVSPCIIMHCLHVLFIQ